MKKPFTATLLSILALFILTGCSKKPLAPAPTPTISTPTVTTTSASAISRNEATLGGAISANGGVSITAIGICYNTSPSPTIANTTIAGTAGVESFLVAVNNLTPNTKYYVRAYATNSAGTAYGNEINFTTNPITTPTVTTGKIVTTTTPFATTTSGQCTDDGGSAIIARGMCWSSAHVPTIVDSKTADGAGIGNFNSSITGLKGNTTYYLRAYASNSIGTMYGDTVTIATDVEGNVYNSVKIGTQTWMLENLKVSKYNDGESIPYVTDPLQWDNGFVLTTPQFCWYNNDINNKNIYGGIYNWLTVSSGKLAPPGWHVPSHSEFGVLIKYLDPATTYKQSLGDTANAFMYYGSSVAGGLLKEQGLTHWLSPNTGATNQSGFTAFGGGERSNFSTFGLLAGHDYYLGFFGGWWSSTNFIPGHSQGLSFRLLLDSNDSTINDSPDGTANGYSVRCIKD